VDGDLAAQVADGLGITPPSRTVANHGRSSPALSMADQPRSIATRKIAVLAGDQTDAGALQPVLEALRGQGAICEIVAPHEGTVATLEVDKQLSAANSVLYDAVLAAGGRELVADGYAVQFVREAFKHCKAVGVLPGAEPLLEAANLPGRQGVVDAGAGDAFAQRFADAVAAHRHWDRDLASFPA
jgi:catalase